MLKQIFEEWRTAILAHRRSDGDPVPVVSFDAGGVDRQNTFPRVVFVPTVGTHDGNTAQAGIGDGITTPPALWLRTVQVELHLWGKDFDDCEDLMQRVARALHGVAWGGDRSLGEDWTRNQGATAKAGVLVVMTVSVEIPITRDQETFAVIEDFAPMTAEIVESLG